MRYQIWIMAAAFILMGIIGWIGTRYSPSYIGLMVFGVISFVLGLIAPK